MDIRKLLEDGTIQRAIEVLETDSVYSEALKGTIDSLHSAIVRQRDLGQRLDDLEVKLLGLSIEV